MALVKLLNGKGIEMPHEKAAGIWQVMHGDIEGTPQQQAFCETVQNVYLNRYNPDLPESYVLARQHVWASMDARRPMPKPQSHWSDR